MADPQHAIVFSANGHHEEEANVSYDSGGHAEELIPAWVDQSDHRPQPVSRNPAHHVFFEEDLLDPSRRGVWVGTIQLKFYSYPSVDFPVAAYLHRINSSDEIQFRIVRDLEGITEPAHLHRHGGPYRFVTKEDVLKAKDVVWNEYWGAVKADVKLVKLKVLLRSYIQVKVSRRWQDKVHD